MCNTHGHTPGNNNLEFNQSFELRNQVYVVNEII